MKKFLFAMTIATCTPIIIINNSIKCNSNDINENQNSFIVYYNKYDKTTEFTIYNDHINMSDMVDIIEYNIKLGKSELSKFSIATIISSYKFDGNIKPIEDNYLGVANIIVEHYLDLKNVDTGLGNYISINYSNSQYHFYGAFPQDNN